MRTQERETGQPVDRAGHGIGSYPLASEPLESVAASPSFGR